MDRGAHALVVVAAWAAGPGKEEHWSLLTRTCALRGRELARGERSHRRQIAQRGDDRAQPPRGRACPLGDVVAGLSPRGEGIVLADVDPAAVDRAREVLPVIANRHLTLGYGLS